MTETTFRAASWRAMAACMLTALLASCGGGGSASSDCTNIDPTRNPNLPGCPAVTPTPTPGTPGTPAITMMPLTLTLSDQSGAATTTVSAATPGVLQTVVRDSTGALLANATVSFTSTDDTMQFVPASGSALTDSAGVARVTVQAGSQAGAFTANAIAVKGTLAATGSLGYSASFPTLSLSAMTISPSPLSAGGTASVSVTVQSGAAAFAPVQMVSFSSPCSLAGKATLSSPVATVAGVATTSYIDKGCGASDTITASTALGGATTSQTGTVQVMTAAAGQIAFVSATPQNIALLGTGGPGRQESSTVVFKVMSASGGPISGVVVDFTLFGVPVQTGTGGIVISPASASTGADGTVSTTISAGTVNTPVRVLATVRGLVPVVTSVSDQLVVSTGIPDQDGMSLSTEIYNVEGAEYDGCASGVGSQVRVSLSDHFRNPVPDGTAVSFTTEGAVIAASCRTGLIMKIMNGVETWEKGEPGVCSVSFCSASPRALDGRLTVLAYVLGEESYIEDPNLPFSINRYDPSESFMDLCEPIRDSGAIMNGDANTTIKDSRSSACRLPVLGEEYIDTNGDGQYNIRGDGLYNGVLNMDPLTGRTSANNRSPTVHVRRSLVQVLSTSKAAITTSSTDPVQLAVCSTSTPFINTPVPFTLAIRDLNPTIFPGNTLAGNILPAGTEITISVSNGTIAGGEASYIVANTNDSSQANWTRTVLIRSDALQIESAATPGTYLCNDIAKSGTLNVRVVTPMGVVTTRSFGVND
jgi:hypothetical protein